MITEKQEKTATRILFTLQRSVFAMWYQTGKFDAYTTGHPHEISKSEVLEDITKLFGVQPDGKIE